jgi:hypothetical protein
MLLLSRKRLVSKMSQYDDLNTTKIALAGFIGTVVVFAASLLLMVLYHWQIADMQQSKVIDRPAEEFAALTASQQGELATYRWIDRENKIVQIPIKEAMELTVADLNKSANPPSQKDAEPKKEGNRGS